MTREREQEKVIRTVVIESFYACPCHQAVTTFEDRKDTDSFRYMFIRSTCPINFGDIIIYDPTFHDWFISRGPLLNFRLPYDNFPHILFNKLEADRNNDHPPHQSRFTL